MRSVTVYFHWSAVMMFGLVVLAALFFGLPFLFVPLGLFTILFSHELGHALVIKRFGYEVDRIEIFPVHGKCYYDEPYSEYEDAVIAWGGVLAQLALFIPAVLFLVFFGSTAYSGINILLVMFTFVNGISMAVNLAPSPGLDGMKTWRLFLIVAKARWSMVQLKRQKRLK